MAIRLPRMDRIRSSPRATRFWPSKRATPRTVALGSRMSPMMLYIDTLLPEPDSPTMPSTSPTPTDSESPSTARTMPARVRNSTWRSSTARSASPTADPRVEAGVEKVDDRVGEHHEEGTVEDRGHDHGQVEILQGVVGEPADAVEIEHHLDQEGGAADQRPEVEPEERHDPDERAPQGVAEEDPTLREALGTGCPDVVLVEGAHHLRPQDARVDPGVEHGEGEPRQEQVESPRTEAGREAHVPGRGDPGEHALVEAALGDEVDDLAEPEPGD